MKIFLVDGYNFIYSIPELRRIFPRNPLLARKKLSRLLSDYCHLQKVEALVIFDAYRKEGEREKEKESPLVSIIYTKEGESADSFIEKFVLQKKREYSCIYVVTSDFAQRQVVAGGNVVSLSPETFFEEIVTCLNFYQKNFLPENPPFVHHLIFGDTLKKILKKRNSIK